MSRRLLKNYSRTSSSTRLSQECLIYRRRTSKACFNQNGDTASLTRRGETLKIWLKSAARITSRTSNRQGSTKTSFVQRFTNSSTARKIRLSNPQASCASFRLTGSTAENKCRWLSSFILRWKAKHGINWLKRSGRNWLRSKSFLLCWWVERMKIVLTTRQRSRRSRQTWWKKFQMEGLIQAFLLMCLKRSMKRLRWLLTQVKVFQREATKSRSSKALIFHWAPFKEDLFRRKHALRLFFQRRSPRQPRLAKTPRRAVVTITSRQTSSPILKSDCLLIV